MEKKCVKNEKNVLKNNRVKINALVVDRIFKHTVPTTKWLDTKSLRFLGIFWEISANCQLKTILKSKIFQIVTVFENINVKIWW